MSIGAEKTPTVRLYMQGDHGRISASTINKSLDQLNRGLMALAEQVETTSRVEPSFTYAKLELGSLDAVYAPAHDQSEAERQSLLSVVPGLKHIGSSRSLPPGWSYEALKYFQKTLELWNEGGAEGMTLEGSGDSVHVDAELVRAIEEAMAGTQKSLGAVIGHVHEWKRLQREEAVRLTVRDEQTNQDVAVIIHEGVLADVKALIDERVVFRGLLSRDLEGNKLRMEARDAEIQHEPSEQRPITDFFGILGPRPDDLDVVEWQRSIREA